jgi:hypothetical protein
MSEQASGTHGPAEDDAIKRQDRRELQAHGERWPESEAAGEGGPEATWAPEGRFAGTPPGEERQVIELRSDLARHLDRTAFPATQAQLVKTLAAHQAEQRLMDLVSSLPESATFDSLHQLLQALGLPVEKRPTLRAGRPERQGSGPSARTCQLPPCRRCPPVCQMMSAGHRVLALGNTTTSIVVSTTVPRRPRRFRRI